MRITEAEVLEAVVLARGCNGSVWRSADGFGFFDCVEGFAKANGDGDGFSEDGFSEHRFG